MEECEDVSAIDGALPGPQLQEDMVTSEVNPFLLLESRIKPILHKSHVIAKLRCSFPMRLDLNAEPKHTALPMRQGCEIDADGDFEVPRSSRQPHEEKYEETWILIEHANSTTLNLVGLQIWRGAFVLSDFILKHTEYFQGKTVLELGSGTGFSSIVAGMVNPYKVVATDLDDENILGLIRTNLNHNKSLNSCVTVTVPLDFLNLNWSAEIEGIVSESDTVIAADVVYHNEITEAFVRTLKKCLTMGKPKDIFIALEKRYVFTLEDLDVVAPTYDHFLEMLESEFRFEWKKICPERRMFGQGLGCGRIWIEELSLIGFPLYFNYEPSKDLVLWHLSNKTR